MSFTKYIAVLTASLLAIACTKELDADISIIGDADITITSEASTREIHFSSTCDWSATADSPWVSVSPSSGKGGENIYLTISIQENRPESGERDAAVSITSKDVMETIHVHQAQKDAIVVGQDKYEFSAAGGSFTLSVSHNVPISVTVSDSAAGWLTAGSSTKSMDSSLLSFIVAENENTESRTGYITITNGTLEKMILVNQGQKDDIVISQEKYEVPACGDDISIDCSSNVDYNVYVQDDCRDWMRVIETKAMKSSRVNLNVSENSTSKARTGAVFISYGDISRVVSISQPAGELTVEKKVYNVESTDGEIEVNVTHNITYDVSIDSSCSDWISYDEAASGEDKLIFNIAENLTTSSRNGIIRVSNGEFENVITVIQEQKNAIIVDNDVYSVPVNGGSFDLQVDHNVDFTVSIDDSSKEWLTQVVTKVMSHSVLSFVVSKNTTKEAREGKIRLFNGSVEKVVIVKQDGPVLPTSLTLNFNELKIIEGSEKTLVASFTPDNVTDASITWSSSDVNVASVVDGVVRGVSSGSAKITAQIGDLTAECTVVVLSEKDLDLEHKVKVALTGNGIVISGRTYFSRTYTITNSSIVDIELVSIATSNSLDLSGTVEAGKSYSTTLYLNYNVYPVVTVTFKYNGKMYSVKTE